jgi:hypothetical protein
MRTDRFPADPGRTAYWSALARLFLESFSGLTGTLYRMGAMCSKALLDRCVWQEGSE